MIWINSVVKCLNQDSRGSRIPSEESFRRRSLCETLMNTLRKLKYKIITDWPTSFRWVIWSKACPSLLFSLYNFHGEANFGISQSFASSVSNRSEHSLLVYDHKLYLGSIQQLIFRVSDRVSQSKCWTVQVFCENQLANWLWNLPLRLFNQSARSIGVQRAIQLPEKKDSNLNVAKNLGKR